MKWYTALAIYTVVWWLILFMVLPWGNHPIAAEDVARAHAAGSPDRPRMLIKFAVTTLVSAVVFAIGYWLYVAGFVTLRR
jgi:predicted secreted protein